MVEVMSTTELTSKNTGASLNCLPLLFSGGIPTCLDDMSEAEFEKFLPYLIARSARLTSASIWTCPSWWPPSLLYSPLSLKEVASSNRRYCYRELVISCYSHHESMSLLDISESIAKKPLHTLGFIKRVDGLIGINDKDSHETLAVIEARNLVYDYDASSSHAPTPSKAEARKRPTLLPKPDKVIVIDDSDDEYILISDEEDEPVLIDSDDDDVICLGDQEERQKFFGILGLCSSLHKTEPKKTLHRCRGPSWKVLEKKKASIVDFVLLAQKKLVVSNNLFINESEQCQMNEGVDKYCSTRRGTAPPFSPPPKKTRKRRNGGPLLSNGMHPVVVVPRLNPTRLTRPSRVNLLKMLETD